MGASVEVPVLIVGGGPVGLSLAIGLRRLGIECLLVERHASTLDFPKGRRVTVRSMEVFRQWGLEPAVTEVALAREESLLIYTGETLLAENFERVGGSLPPDAGNSPTQEAICLQDLLEPVLRDAARSLGADVRFATELTGFSEGADAIDAQITDLNGGGQTTLRAAYMVAADGLRSGVRAALGIESRRLGELGHFVSMLVEANLSARIADRSSALYRVEHPRASTFAVVDNDRRWLLMLSHDPAREPPDSFTEERCTELVAAGIGDATVPLRFLGRRFWQAAADVADRFRQGRVLLAGDAAHVTTPFGGLGMNCGIADAHNLAWKLAAVISGWGGPTLLDTYQQERRPVALNTAQASLGSTRPPRPVDALVLGYGYASDAVAPDGTASPSLDDPIGEYVPTGRPGHRAPHVWIRGAGGKQSVLDLFGEGFVALADSSRADALRAIEATSQPVPFRTHVVQEPALLDVYGVREGGVVLVRPDGHVAWRSSAADPARELAGALRKAAGHPDSAR